MRGLIAAPRPAHQPVGRGQPHHNHAEAEVQEAAALVFTWLLLVGGLRTTVELWSTRRRSRSRMSDADVLARLTRVPAPLWNALFVLVALAALHPSARLLARMVG